MAANKRQHYVPKFLLRRFAATNGRWQGHIFRLETATGRPRPAVPRTEAAKNRYYDLPEDVAGEFQPERILAAIEGNGAAAIRHLEQRESPQPSDVVWLAYFSALQTSRTPLDRAERRYLDGVMAQQLEQLRLSARDEAVAFLRKNDPELTDEQADLQRRQLIEDLEAGRIRVQSTAEREVAGMFLGLDAAVGELIGKCNWALLEFPDGAQPLVLPDTGYTRYDPRPRVPGGGSGFLDTGTVETVIPVSPSSALVITRGSGRTGIGEGTSAYAEDLNLRAYAQAQVCIYGRCQQDVVGVHRSARKQPAAVIERRRRARTLWIGERHHGGPEGGPTEFTGYSIDGIRTQLFDVDPRAREEQNGLTPKDMWD
jgi:hypothetical protein